MGRKALRNLVRLVEAHDLRSTFFATLRVTLAMAGTFFDRPIDCLKRYQQDQRREIDITG